MNPNKRVLRRCEAMQMVTDLGDAIENVIMLASDSSDLDKALALDTLVTLQTKRNLLQTELADADREVTP